MNSRLDDDYVPISRLDDGYAPQSRLDDGFSPHSRLDDGFTPSMAANVEEAKAIKKKRKKLAQGLSTTRFNKPTAINVSRLDRDRFNADRFRR